MKKWQIGWSQHCPVYGRLHICARHSVERIAQRGEVFDFAHEVAVPFPLRIMMDILGLPEKDDPLVLKLARGRTGAEDPDRALSGHPAESMRLAGIGFRTYFDIVTADRRARPNEDLSSAIANARIGGKLIPDYERLSYFMQLAIAGQENTAYSIAGGVHALLEHPDQMTKLQSNPALLILPSRKYCDGPLPGDTWCELPRPIR